MFLSGATGVAVVAAVIRGFARRDSSSSLGNFWQDLVRTLLYVLLPLSFAGALLLASQGAIQSLAGSVGSTAIHGAGHALALGPVASLESIKLLSGDGGGFFNVNSAMPFENPTPFSNFVEMLSILLIPAALTATFGRMVGNRRQGWALYAAMLAILVAGIAVTAVAEQHGTPAQHAAGVSGANMEGKEQRFGIAGSATWAAVTTAGGDGAVNSGHESYTGIGGAVPLFNMATGEVVFGGPGSGLYGMLLVVLLAVFIAGLMIGRTPEYLGKKIAAREIKFVLISTLVVPTLALGATAVAIATKYGAPSMFASGPQGFSETLYAYTSQTVNNGSAFAGYTGFVQPNAPGNVGAFGITFADVVGGLAMLFGRFVPMFAALAVAGVLSTKRTAPAGAGTLRTDTPTFVVLVVAVVVIVAALTFLPALLLGPVVQGLTGRLF
jgi:K+-transporting ATPase ATPase A chain